MTESKTIHLTDEEFANITSRIIRDTVYVVQKSVSVMLIDILREDIPQDRKDKKLKILAGELSNAVFDGFNTPKKEGEK